MILSLGYSGEYCNKHVCGSLSSTLILFSLERGTHPIVELLGGAAVLVLVLEAPLQTVSITAALTEARQQLLSASSQKFVTALSWMVSHDITDLQFPVG